MNTGGWPSSPSGKAPSCLRRDSSRSWIFSKPCAPLGCWVCQIRPSLPTQQTINFNHSNYFLKHTVCDKDMNYLHLSHLSFGLLIFKKCTLVLIGTLPLYLSTNVDTRNCTVTFILIYGLTQHICFIYMNGQHVHVRACTHADTHSNHLLLFQHHKYTSAEDNMAQDTRNFSWRSLWKLCVTECTDRYHKSTTWAQG